MADPTGSKTGVEFNWPGIDRELVNQEQFLDAELDEIIGVPNSPRALRWTRPPLPPPPVTDICPGGSPPTRNGWRT